VKPKIKVLLSLVCIISLFFSFTLVAQASRGKSASHRFYGKDRFQTSTSVASELDNGQKVQNIILASAYNFPDALSASTLAYQLKAPIILVSPGYEDSMISYNFVKDHLVVGGTVTIVGGSGIISHGSEQWLLDKGLHVKRLGGKDRFGTNALIVNQLNVPKGTPVIIVSAENFPDALGISSLAASKGWPILLSNPSNLTQSVQDFLISDKPTNVYVVGGEGVLHNGLYNQISLLSPNSQIQRLGGSDRFETLSLILNKFYPHPTQIYVANGFDFADALSGSTLAATHNAPILLVDPKRNDLPKSIYDYLITLRNNGVQPQVNVLGGESAVPQRLLDQINDILESTGGTTPSSTNTETFTVSNPETNGFTVTVSPALDGLTISNFKLLNSNGNPVAITSATTINGGATYALTASLNAGKKYTLTAIKTGYTFGTVQFVPTTTSSETLTVFNPSTTGFSVGVSSAINNMTVSDFKLFNCYGNPVAITSATTLNGGATYALNASLNDGQTYSLTAIKTGYTFGTVQFVPKTSTH
jgi:putative cell wall-binding protein